MTTAAETTDPRTLRREEAFRLCTAERVPGADLLPADLPFLEAWTTTRDAAAGDRARAIDIIDGFLRAFLGDLRDLALRARVGRAPAPVLDDIARTLAAVA